MKVQQGLIMKHSPHSVEGPFLRGRPGIRWGSLAALALVMVVLTCRGSLAAEVDGPYVVRLYDRVVAIGEALLEFEKVVLFRLEKNRPLDVTRSVARFQSARDQMRRLRKMAKGLLKKLPPGAAPIAEVERRKARLQEIKAIHKANMAAIQARAPSEFAAAATLGDDAFAGDDEDTNQHFPIKTVDGEF